MTGSNDPGQTARLIARLHSAGPGPPNQTRRGPARSRSATVPKDGLAVATAASGCDIFRPAGRLRRAARPLDDDDRVRREPARVGQLRPAARRPRRRRRRTAGRRRRRRTAAPASRPGPRRHGPPAPRPVPPADGAERRDVRPDDARRPAASDSTSSASAAPRDSASSPTAPEPANRSSEPRPSSSVSVASVVNSASRTRSEVGRVSRPDGAASRRPPYRPATIAQRHPFSRYSGALLVDQRGDRGRAARGAGPARGRRRPAPAASARASRDQLAVAQQGQQPQVRAAAGLRRAEHVALAALLQVELGQLEPVQGGGDRVQPRPGPGRPRPPR